MKLKGWLAGALTICMLGSMTACGSASGTELQTVSVSSAEDTVQVTLQGVDFTLHTGEESFTVSTDTGDVVGTFVSGFEFENIQASMFDDGAYSEITVGGNSGFSYVEGDSFVHLYDAGDAVYVRLSSEVSEDVIYSVESALFYEKS